MAMKQKGGKKAKRSSHNKETGKYARQAIRTAKNKAKRKAKNR